jgi:hypothetical protein
VSEYVLETCLGMYSRVTFSVLLALKCCFIRNATFGDECCVNLTCRSSRRLGWRGRLRYVTALI